MILNKISLEQLSQKLNNIPLYNSISAADVLNHISFFKDISKEVLADLVDKIELYEFREKAIICRHGKFNEYFYIILSGEIKAVIPTQEDPLFEIYRLSQGDFFGEEIIFSSEPRESSIITTKDTMVLALGHDAMKQVTDASASVKTLMDERYISRKLHYDLRSVPLFTQLEKGLFEEILKKVTLLTIPENREIFCEDDQGDSFYLIRDGEVNVYRNINGSETVIAILSDGQFFGEMSLISDEKRNATVKTTKRCNLVRITREDFLDIVKKDDHVLRELREVVEERQRNKSDVLKNPNIALITRNLLDLNKAINKHLDIISQCTVNTEKGSALLATLPGSRYPYVYPRDSACCSRLLFKLVTMPLKAGEIAFRLLEQIALYIMNCQREDGYWGQRYGLNAEDKGIYRQEDNVAHGIIIICRYLLAAKIRNTDVPLLDRFLNAIDRGAEYARRNYYRNEIHLFYSTTSIHESAIEEGYSIWVNFAYRLMLQLTGQVAREYNVTDRFAEEMKLKKGFEPTIHNVFKANDRFVRRLKPDGVVDLRPDITLLSPFFFGTGMLNDSFIDDEIFRNSVDFIVQDLWDPDLDMLQRYLPFIEDPHTHIHAGNGPWLQYTAVLAQYYYYTGNVEKGDEVMAIIDRYKTKEGYLCEHLTTAERFYEFKKLEWLPGQDFEKEFSNDIMVPDITYDLIVEELNHMKNSYDEIERRIASEGEDGFLSFATPLMWSHAEYAMSLLLQSDARLKELKEQESYTK